MPLLFCFFTHVKILAIILKNALVINNQQQQKNNNIFQSAQQTINFVLRSLLIICDFVK